MLFGFDWLVNLKYELLYFMIFSLLELYYELILEINVEMWYCILGCSCIRLLKIILKLKYLFVFFVLVS